MPAEKEKKMRSQNNNNISLFLPPSVPPSLPISIVATFEHYVHGEGWVTRSVLMKVSTPALKLAKYVNDIGDL